MFGYEFERVFKIGYTTPSLVRMLVESMRVDEPCFRLRAVNSATESVFKTFMTNMFYRNPIKEALYKVDY